MKGFPNQIADLDKLARGMRTLVDLVDGGFNARDDGVLGEALVRAGVAGTGHSPAPVEQYIANQLTKRKSDQSFRATARGLKEFYGMLGMIDYSTSPIAITAIGRQAATFAGTAMDAAQTAFWRRVIRNMSHDGGDGTSSHPYQVLLRLISQKPGIAKPLCALALEARDDSAAELERIIALADLPEDDARIATGASQRNWDNAVKVLPRLAEQLNDVTIVGSLRARSYQIADAPGAGGSDTTPTGAPNGPSPDATTPSQPRDETVPNGSPRAPRSARSVTPDSIGMAGIADRDEPPIPPNLDPAAALAALNARLDRLRRHNTLVRAFASRLSAVGMDLYEYPFDLLGLIRRIGVMVEMKTLSGAVDDEREQVRDALSQLLYYGAFISVPNAAGAVIHKVACFDAQITDEHQNWLNSLSIGTVWRTNDGNFTGDALAASMLGGFLEELR